MSTSRPRIRDRFLPGLISFLGPAILRTLGRTWRFRRIGLHPHVERSEQRSSERFIIAFWHETLLPLTYLHRGEDATVLVSQHGDGELIVRVLLGLGYQVARGSSTRGGARAFLELVRAARDKTSDIGVTPDGPKGPARTAHEGIVQLAAHTGLRILPFAAACEHAWRLRSWDRFQIPKPGTRIAVVTGEPIAIPTGLGKEERSRYLALYESEMQSALARAEEELKRDW